MRNKPSKLCKILPKWQHFATLVTLDASKQAAAAAAASSILFIFCEMNRYWDDAITKLTPRSILQCTRGADGNAHLRKPVVHRQTNYPHGKCLWLWRSWQSGRFQYQRSAVRIQSFTNFISHQLQYRDENKEKEVGNGPF